MFGRATIRLGIGPHSSCFMSQTKIKWPILHNPVVQECTLFVYLCLEHCFLKIYISSYLQFLLATIKINGKSGYSCYVTVHSRLRIGL